MSLIIDYQKIFFHIPKTGGNSFRSFLQNQSIYKLKEKSHKHATPDFFYGSLKRHSTQLLAPMKAITYEPIIFVRNPITWYESWYKYQLSRGVVKWGGSRRYTQWHPISSLDNADFRSFSSFICSVYDSNPFFLTTLYSRYLTEQGSVVCRMEDLALNLEKELMRMGLKKSKFKDFRYPIVRPSPKLEIVWSKKIRQKVVENEGLIFERFRYGDR